MAQIPKGRLVKGPYKPIWRDCAIYFYPGVPGCHDMKFFWFGKPRGEDSAGILEVLWLQTIVVRDSGKLISCREKNKSVLLFFFIFWRLLNIPVECIQYLLNYFYRYWWMNFRHPRLKLYILYYDICWFII